MKITNPDGSVVDARHGMSVYVNDAGQRCGFSQNGLRVAEKLVGATVEAAEVGYDLKIRFADGRKLVVVGDGEVGFYIVNYDGPWDVGGGEHENENAR